MKYEDAKEFVCELTNNLDNKGIDHYTISDAKKGNTRFIEIMISIKISKE